MSPPTLNIKDEKLLIKKRLTAVSWLSGIFRANRCMILMFFEDIEPFRRIRYFE